MTIIKMDVIDHTAEAIDQWHVDNQEPPRYHLGASQLGHHCDRWLWLNFRWAIREEFSGRILRLFRRGHHEENWIVEDLRNIGVEITDTGDDQSRVDFGCHVSGSIDGIIHSGVPAAPNTKHVAEFKTHSDKSFKELVKDKVKKAKPVHYAQMQLYMLGTGIDRAFYVAINKDNDHIYTERVKLDKDFAEKLKEKGHRIALSDRMPEPCPGASASWYQCKWCPALDFCHDTHLAESVNCRTCANVTPTKEGTFRCEKNGCDIPNEAQLGSYPCHVLHPDLVPWQMLESDVDFVAAYKIGENTALNGEGHTHSLVLLDNVSREILANFDVEEVKLHGA